MSDLAKNDITSNTHADVVHTHREMLHRRNNSPLLMLSARSSHESWRTRKFAFVRASEWF
jgi:hypothetical protein